MIFTFDKGIAPDLPERGHGFLVKARNCYSGVLGYEPVRSPSALTTALPAAWLGSGAFRDPTGVVTLLAAASGLGLYTLTATTATLVYSSATTANWFFCQFGGLAIGFNGGAPVKHNLSTGVAALLGGSPPAASMGAIVRDFVFVAGNSTNQNRIYWSAINNAEGWTIGLNQCSTQDLPDEGAITGLAGGEYGLAFQDASINIFEYVGSPVIFSRRKISKSVGALCHGSIAQHGMRTFFYSRRGFFMWSPNEPEPVPIGRNKVDKTFRNSYSIADIRNLMRATIDPERSLVIWSMPDRLWVYNFENDMWSDILYPGIVGITFSRTASITLEGVASTYPDIDLVGPNATTTNLGSELVTNGTFDTATTGWTAVNATLSIVTARIRVTNSASISGGGDAIQDITVTPGREYRLLFNAYNGTANAVVNVGDTVGTGIEYMNSGNMPASGIFYFTPTTSSVRILLNANSSVAGQYADFDNISLKPFTPSGLSLDDPFWNAGDPLLTFAYSDNRLYAFGGATSLDASLRLPNLEINEGRVTHVRSSKITGNMLAAQISIDCRARLGDNPRSVTSQDFRANGELPIRCSGRYLQPEITILGTNVWSSVQGVDFAVSSGESL